MKKIKRFVSGRTRARSVLIHRFSFRFNYFFKKCVASAVRVKEKHAYIQTVHYSTTRTGREFDCVYKYTK